MNRPAPSFSFIVPALNEEKNLPAVIGEIASAAVKGGISDYEIIVIDDGSKDGTAAVVAELSSRYGSVKFVRNETRQGVGKSFLAGVAIAQKDYSLIVPGDNEFDLGFFPGAVAALSAGASSFVVTHVLNPWLRPYHRRTISFLYLYVFNFLFRTDFRYTNGIVIYPTGWIRSMELLSAGYTFQSEALLKAHREGKRFAHAGMNIRPRAYGKTKIFSFSVMVEVMASLVRIKLADHQVPHEKRKILNNQAKPPH
ncbi:MAG: glycosyltransferase family 2 protein [Methylococcales bacterium]|nr:glycosyltransferase family 2 protein [Methylococcales bacterium]